MERKICKHKHSKCLDIVLAPLVKKILHRFWCAKLPKLIFIEKYFDMYFFSKFQTLKHSASHYMSCSPFNLKSDKASVYNHPWIDHCQILSMLCNLFYVWQLWKTNRCVNFGENEKRGFHVLIIYLIWLGSYTHERCRTSWRSLHPKWLKNATCCRPTVDLKSRDRGRIHKYFTWLNSFDFKW